MSVTLNLGMMVNGAPTGYQISVTRQGMMGASSGAVSDFNALQSAVGKPIKCRRVFSSAQLPSSFNGSPIAVDYTAKRRVIYSSKNPMATFSEANFRNFWATVPTDMFIDYTEWHEPEAKIKQGLFNLTQWKNHIARVGVIIQDLGNPRWRMAIILLGEWTFTPAGFAGLDFWDPRFDEVVDVIGFDQYAPPGTRRIEHRLMSKPSGNTWAPVPWARDKGKHILVPEWGVSDDWGEGTKANYIDTFGQWFRAQEDMDYACYFNNNKDLATNPDYSWEVHGQSLTALSSALS